MKIKNGEGNIDKNEAVGEGEELIGDEQFEKGDGDGKFI